MSRLRRPKRALTAEIADALAPDPADDPCGCPDCRAAWGLDVDPLAFEEEGDRWRFEDAQPYADAP